MKVIAVDFDGTLCEDKWPAIGRANRKLISDLIHAQEMGDSVILWTCRTGEQLKEAVEWCAGHKLVFDAVNENIKERIDLYGGDTRKVSADVYIDDKNLITDEPFSFH